MNHDDRDAVTSPASDQPGPIGAYDLPLHARDYDIAADTEAFDFAVARLPREGRKVPE
jgi:hypothetical protein